MEFKKIKLTEYPIILVPLDVYCVMYTEKFQSLCRKTLELCQNNETDPNQKPAFAKNIASFTTYDL